MTGGLLDWLVAGLLVAGGVFGMIGNYGLLRLADPMQRLHAPTKASTMGLACVLLGAALWLGIGGRSTGAELVVILLVFVTAPLSAFTLSKVYIAHHAKPGELPPTGLGTDWATLDRDTNR
jgi:multicomponent K+:H+ antiporter subunit G